MTIPRLTIALLAPFFMIQTALPCDVVIVGKHPKLENVPVNVMTHADVIVRAMASGYAEAPEKLADGSIRASGWIRFQVLEVLRGKPLPDLTLFGELVESDDFNTHPVPYNGARPGAYRGACVAWQYRTGAQYLLMLARDPKAGLKVMFYPFAPVNEQLHGDDDPWLLWVRDHAKRSGLLRR